MPGTILHIIDIRVNKTNIVSVIMELTYKRTISLPNEFRTIDAHYPGKMKNNHYSLYINKFLIIKF